MSAIHWLASYPKSGNTWTRAFLTAYLQEKQGPVNLDAMVRGENLIMRVLFDEITGLNSGEMTEAEIARAWPGYCVRLDQESAPPSFVKTHSAFRRRGDGEAMFPSGCGVIYIVRNPLDVVPSYAHHTQQDFDWTIARMANPDATMARSMGSGSEYLPQHLGTWSDHVRGWIEQDRMPLLLLRYEDMIADPAGQFTRLIEFAGFVLDPVKLDHAVAATRFGMLQAIEAASGFREGPSASIPFFRQGRAGGWRTALHREQIAKIVAAHSGMMARLGYLDEAMRFLDRE